MVSLVTTLLQKLAIRDQSAMMELLQISCVMAYLWPKLETHLGQGKALDDVQKMWQLGHLGCQKVRMLKMFEFSKQMCCLKKNMYF